MSDDELLAFLKKHQCGHYVGAFGVEFFYYAWNEHDYPPVNGVFHSPSIHDEVRHFMSRWWKANGKRRCEMLASSVSSYDNFCSFRVSAPR